MDRRILKQNEDLVDDFDSKLDKLIRSANSAFDAGRTFVKHQSAFLSCLNEIATDVPDEDGSWRTSAEYCINSASNACRILSELLDHTNHAVKRSLKSSLRSDLHQVKEMRRHFEKISADFDNALVKNSQIAVSKAADAEETDNLLTATRSLFLHTSLDYVNQLTLFQSKKRLQLLQFMLSHAEATSSFFTRGKNEYEELESRLAEARSVISKIRAESDETEKKLEKRHAEVKSFHNLPFYQSSDDIRLEGYLFKRSSNAFKTWNRRWFMIKDNKLMYRKRNDNTGEDVTVMQVDLRLCTVKRFDMERRFCFEVVSPTKSHVLQAESEEACHRWMSAMAAGIDAAYGQLKDNTVSNMMNKNHSSESLLSYKGSSKSSTSSDVTSEARSLRPSSEILLHSENQTCCDCGSPDPKWASINFCITLCIECSGIHRSLGVHVSKGLSLFTTLLS